LVEVVDAEGQLQQVVVQGEVVVVLEVKDMEVIVVLAHRGVAQLSKVLLKVIV
jgi:hypothetical protein